MASGDFVREYCKADLSSAGGRANNDHNPSVNLLRSLSQAPIHTHCLSPRSLPRSSYQYSNSRPTPPGFCLKHPSDPCLSPLFFSPQPQPRAQCLAPATPTESTTAVSTPRPSPLNPDPCDFDYDSEDEEWRCAHCGVRLWPRRR